MSINKTTLVIGASEKSERYSNKAIKLLIRNNHKVLAYGLRKGKIESTFIETDLSAFKGILIDTITMYINPLRQAGFYQAIIDLKPKRVIFNPGTENPEFESLLLNNKIEVEEACTLIMLNTHQY